MFSLIITLVAIVLVVALALATIYYGGPSLNRAKVRAEAATLVNQAAQVDAAIVLFHMNTGRWPASEEELVAGKYLEAVPQAPAKIASNFPLVVDLLVPSAQASETLPWRQIAPSTPQFWVLRAISKPVCQAINLQVRGDNGIYNAAVPGQKIQCFGEDENYTVLLHYAALDSAQPIETTVPENGGTPTLLVEPTGGGWAVTPDNVSATPSPGNEGGTTSPTATVENLVPSSGPDTGGTSVTVTGSNFQDGDQVLVNGTPVATTVASSTQLTFVTPASDAGPATITVSSSGNISNALSFTYAVAAPTISTVAPTTGPAAGGTPITLTGQNFQSDAQVSVGGMPVPTTRVSNTQLTFTTPSGSAGPADVTVTSGGKTSTAATFNYTAPTGGKVTTLAVANIPQNLGNVAADDNGYYVVSGKNFYYSTYAGATTVLKSSGWGAPCADADMQTIAWAQQPNGDFAVIGNCSTPSGTSYALRVSATGQLVGTARTDTGLLVALTTGPDSALYYNRRDGTPANRWIRRLLTDGSYLSGPATGQSTLGMAVDPTQPYIYFVTQQTPTNMALNRCRTSDMSGCTSVSIGLLDYPTGTTGDTLAAHPFLAFDGTGQLYAASQSTIYKLDKNTGAATQYAGQPGTQGFTDGTGTAARLSIKSIGRGPNGKIYIHDNGSGGAQNAIRRLD